MFSVRQSKNVISSYTTNCHLESAKQGEAKTYEFQRTKTFFLMGTFFIAPILHVNYSYLLPYMVPNVTPMGAIQKLAIDQLIAAPLIMLIFYPVINVVEGKPIS